MVTNGVSPRPDDLSAASERICAGSWNERSMIHRTPREGWRHVLSRDDASDTYRLDASKCHIYVECKGGSSRVPRKAETVPKSPLSKRAVRCGRPA